LPFFDSRAALYALLALVTLVVLVGHHAVPPMDRDESRFAQASRQMQQTGDYVTVRFQDELRAKKPAGIYWLQSGFASLMGVDDIAAYRFVNVLAFLAAILMLYHMGLQLYEPRAALAASALLASGFIVLGEAHLAKTDTLLMMLALGQQWALMGLYIRAETAPDKSDGRWLWFWLTMAAGIMVKGPVLPGLAVLTVLALCVWDRRVKWVSRLRLGYGVLLVLVLCLPWAIMVSAATDGAFLNIAVKGDFLAKVQSGQESHGAPPGSYALLLGLLIWPATPLLVTVFSASRATLSVPAIRFLLAWMIPFWIMLELIPTKLPHYILPVLPALMLLLAGRVVSSVDARPPASWRGHVDLALRYVSVGLGFGFAATAVLGAMTFGGAGSRTAMLWALLTLLLATVALWFGHQWIKRRLWTPFFAFVGAALLLHVTVFSGVVPALSRLHVSRAIANQIAMMDQTPTAIAAAGYHEPSLVFHLGRDLLLVDGREAALFLVEAPGGLAIIEQRQNADFIAAAAALGLRLQAPTQIDGYNMSKGQDVEIHLYRAEMFDAKAGRE